jgi:hypothetical protein
MTLIARMSVVECNWCGDKTTLHHEIEYEGDSGYPFNKALEQAGWTEPWDKDEGYTHRCPKCTTALKDRPKRQQDI